MKQDEMKKLAAEAAIEYVPHDTIVGVGTGSTVNYFIEALGRIKNKIEGAVASSAATEQRLKQLGIPVFDLNAVGQVAVYVDGTDEFNEHLYLIKGQGGAMTREKIIATASKQFVCIADQSKKVAVLGGRCPIPIEVIPMARSYVARQLLKLGGDPVYREGVTTDNNNVILDFYNIKIREPIHLEEQLKNITGVVETGLFAKRRADVVLMSNGQTIERFINN